MANLAYFFLELIIVLSIFQIDFYSVWLPISTIVISLSFALSPTIQQMMTNLFFVLVMQPYENGDRVAIDTVASGATLTVQTVNFVTTELVDGSGKRMIVPNNRVATSVVTNLRRSPVASFSPKFTVPASVSSDQLASLGDAVAGYLRTRILDWKPGGKMSVAFTDGNKLEVSWSLTHLCGWSEGGRIWPAVSDFNLFVLSAMRRLGMTYSQPPLPVDVMNSDGIRAAVSAAMEAHAARPTAAAAAASSNSSGEHHPHDPHARHNSSISADGLAVPAGFTGIASTASSSSSRRRHSTTRPPFRSLSSDSPPLDDGEEEEGEGAPLLGHGGSSGGGGGGGGRGKAFQPTLPPVEESE